jgi:hypothetical protein
MFCLKCNSISYTAKEISFSKSLNEEETTIDLADNNNLKSQEAYNNIISGLSSKL